jgi:predicted Fe-Mo cluster-binding NifX family protein
MTRIAISADDGSGLDSAVSAHFGRCPYFVLVDLEEGEITEVRALPNPYYEQHQPGQVPQFIHGQQADAMLSGGMGGRAIAMFQQYGIVAATGATGTVRSALEAYWGGELQGVEPCHESTEHGHGGTRGEDGQGCGHADR